MHGMTLRSQKVLAGLAVAAGALIIGCGGGGDNGFNSTNGTLNTSSTSNPTNSTSNPTNSTSNPTNGTPTTPGALPQNEILFTVNDETGGYLRRVKPDGTGGTILAQYPTNVVAVAPDPQNVGRYVFFASSTTDGPFRIYRGTNSVDPAASTAISTQTFAFVGDLAFAPDGNTVFFVASTTDSAPRRLYKLPVSGGTPEVLDNALRLAVSPVGQKLVYSKDNAEFTGSDIYVRDYNAGSTPTRLTTAVAENSYPAFNRAGTKIVYSSNANGSYELFTINPDGTGNVQVTTTADLDEFGASFNEDGTKLAYSALSNELGGSGIYVANVNGSGRQQVAADASIDFDVYWTSSLGRGATKVPQPDGFMLRRPVLPKR